MEAFIDLIFPLLMLVFFFFVGGFVERRHLKSLKEREEKLEGIMVHQLKSLPPGWTVIGDPVLLAGSVVIANDYFKAFKSTLKKIIGGNLGEYERLLERGRREAIVRLKEKALAQGCNVVWNIRMDTAMMQDKRRNASSAEIIIYGTGMRVQ